MNKYAVLIFLILTSAVCSAQNEAYIIPRLVFTGDPAVLIVPLNDEISESADIILNPLSHYYPSHPDIDFHRIVLERRSSRKRLMIEFTAYVPGVLELPVIEIGDIHFSGLTITINSVMDSRSSPVLSRPASSLAMPGTALMLYGTMAAFIFFVFLTIWFVLKGRIFINNIKEKWKHWKLFSSMKKTEKRLTKSVINGENSRLILDKLSEQFRIFLSVLTGENCRTMTASEFEKLPLYVVMKTTTQYQEITPAFLYDFFRECDDLRFSGINAASQDILYLLACLRRFITAAENANRKIVKKEEQAA